MLFIERRKKFSQEELDMHQTREVDTENNF